jgi:hypothetical protein
MRSATTCMIEEKLKADATKRKSYSSQNSALPTQKPNYIQHDPGSGSNGPIGARRPFPATARQTAVRQFLALRLQGNPQESFQ